MRHPKLIAKLRARLPQEVRHLFDEAVRLSDKLGISVYLVGGPMRDLLVDRPSLDIDIAVEGDAMALARELASATSGRAVVHAAFLTATVRVTGFHVDLITARSETYARPGALPTVKPAIIQEDLLRRDFTVNALALRLTGPDAGEILDPAGGQRDLDARLIRVLHKRSFQDDATRILRTFRYATRLGFKIEPETLRWLKRDLSYLDTISGTRLRNEFSKVLAEGYPERICRGLRSVGALHTIHPAMSFGDRRAGMFESLRCLIPNAVPTGGWTLLVWGLSDGEVSAISRRLALTKSQAELVAAAPRMQEIQERLSAAPPTRSGLVTLLSPYPLAAIWALAAVGNDSVRQQCTDYLERARFVRPLLTGDDIVALGIERGPKVGQALARLRAAKLDGRVSSRDEEEDFIRQIQGETNSSSVLHLPSSRR